MSQPAVIFSKKTNAELIDLSSNVASHRADFVAEKARVANRENDVDASLSAVLTSIADNLSLFDDEKARVAQRESDVDASLGAIISTASADKAELQANIDQANADGVALVNSVDAKHDANKVFLDNRIDDVNQGFLDADLSLSNRIDAEKARVDTLEQKVGDDLVSTVNGVLSEQVIQQTLDAYLATDSELATEVSNAVTARVADTTQVKTDFNNFIDVMFEAFTFENVTKEELKMALPQ